MSILVVGSVAIDTVKSPFGEATDVLGGSAVYFSLAAQLFAPVHLVGVVGKDFPEKYITLLRDKYIDLQGLEIADGRTFRWTGEYHYDLNTRDTLNLELNVFSEFDPAVPDAYITLPYLCLANIDPVLQEKVLNATKPRVVVSDTMDHWISGSREALIALLKKVNVFILNDAEARLLSKEHNLCAAARFIRALGPQAVIIKKGEHGALLVDDEGYFAAPAYPLEEIFDPTGAGDSFAGGFMGYLAQHDNVDPVTLRQAVIYGSALASFCVERFSADRLVEISRDDVEERVKAFKTLTQF